MSVFETSKTLILATLITVGLLLQQQPAQAGNTETLTVAGGCFWCVEADFEQVPGVIEAISGFTGGETANPTYKQVTKGGTGHYEAVQITFDPSQVSRDKLLSLFFRSIDPTDAGGQFCDRGESYRSAVFAGSAQEQSMAEKIKDIAEEKLGRAIVTPILPEGQFYPADAAHQDYYKGTKLVLTRFGPRKQSTAYKLYRQACGRDTRVKALWGADAPFIGS